MIRKKELEKLAQAKGVRSSTIDKDWVLGQFVDAIYSIPRCRTDLVFKGGTCLKKCWVSDYRFSEDLDFTSINPDFVFDRPLLEEIAALVTERAGIPVFIESLEMLRFQNMPTGYAAIVKFWGADHRRDQQPPEPSRWTSSIKIEIILYEKMLFPIENRPLICEYSDQQSMTAGNIPCYSIHEVLSEKLRALIQRSYTAPRDFYDIWYLSRHVKNIDWKIVVEAFHAKMAFKKLTFTGIEQILNNDNDFRLKAAWDNSLKHQISFHQMIDYETVRTDLEKLFEEIFVGAK